MPQTHSQLHFPIIFSTKHRTPCIDATWRERLWQYMGGIVNNEGGIPLQIGGTADHVHLLVTLLPRHTPSTFVQKLKAGSSGWVHDHFPAVEFWWQAGYGAFTVSHSGLKNVRGYILNQEEHHRTVSFQDEFRTFLIKHGIEFDERYIWN